MKQKKLKNLIIIGAGDFGREVYAWAKQSKEHGRFWKIKGFIDDNLHALDDFKYKTKIISSVKEYRPQDNDLFVCAIGNISIKKRLASIILGRGGKFINIIHPTVVFGENVRLGTGVILCPYAVVSSDATLGDFVFINLHVSIGHDTKVGDWCFVGTGCALNGHVILEDSVFVAGHVIILPKGSVGSGTVVGAGSMVVGRIKPNITVLGIPAKELRFPKSINN